MEETEYGRDGKPIKETPLEAVKRLTERINQHITYKYSQGFVYDRFEIITKEEIDHKGYFDCSRENIGKTILAVHDVKDQEVLSLLIGPYLPYRKTVLEKFSRRISSMIYRIGMKDQVIDIIFIFLLKEMKDRFSKKGSGYIFSGVEGIREEGIIRKK